MPSAKRPINNLEDPIDERLSHSSTQNKTARHRQAVDAPTAAKAPIVNPLIARNVANSRRDSAQKENNANTRRSSTRGNFGKGGHLHQLAKVADNIRPDLALGNGSNTTRREPGNFPEGLPENAMAPPSPRRRQKKSATSSTTGGTSYKQPIRPDLPLQSAPVPTLHPGLPGSPYGLQQVMNDYNVTAMPQSMQNMPHQAAFMDANAYQQSQTNGASNFLRQEWNSARNDTTMEECRQYIGNESHECNNLTNVGTGLNGHNFEPHDDLEDFYTDGETRPKYHYQDGIGLLVGGETEQIEASQFPNNGNEEQTVRNNSPALSLLDERSPSEDEAAALDVLHGHGDLSNDTQDMASRSLDLNPLDLEDDSEDVLQEHRRRNHTNQAPCSQQLSLAARQQSRNFTDRSPSLGAYRSNVDRGEVVAASDSSDEDIAVKKRAKRHSKSKALKPTTLSFYPLEWQVVLIRAKQKWQRHIVLDCDNPFPERERYIDEAKEILSKTISESRSNGKILSDAYQHDRNMDIVVFQEGSTFRGQLKIHAVNIVKTYYRDVIEPRSLCMEMPGQRQYQQAVQNNLDSLLKHSAFHLDGTDDQGKSNNFAHPAIPALIHQFFYTGNECLAALFPDDFSERVPVRVIALVLTVIKNALQEWNCLVLPKVQIPFTGDRFRSVFTSMLMAIKKVQSNSYHREKFETNRTLWATIGMGRLRNADDLTEDTSVEVVLD